MENLSFREGRVLIQRILTSDGQVLLGPAGLIFSLSLLNVVVTFVTAVVDSEPVESVDRSLILYLQIILPNKVLPSVGL